MALFCIAACLESAAFRPYVEDKVGDGDAWPTLCAFFGGILCAIAGVGAVTEERIAKTARPLAVFVLFVIGLCLCLYVYIAWH